MAYKKQSIVLLLSSIIAVCALLPLLAQAQSKAIKTDALIKEADLIVVGKVGHVESAWADGKKRIETRVFVSIDETIKGTPEEKSITVVVPGGEVDGVGEWYSHTPRFERDEDVVLFAKKDSGGRYRVAAGEQGKFSVTKDSRTGAKTVDNVGSLEAVTAKLRKTVKEQDTGTLRKE